MSADWQLIAVIAIVSAAAIYTVRSWLRSLNPGKAGCGSACGKCGNAAEPTEKKFSLPVIQPPNRDR